MKIIKQTFILFPMFLTIIYRTKIMFYHFYTEKSFDKDACGPRK